jgi:hypothetical protein
MDKTKVDDMLIEMITPKVKKNHINIYFMEQYSAYEYTYLPHRTAPHRTAPHRTAPHRTAPQFSNN